MSCRKGDRKVEVRKGGKKGGGVGRKRKACARLKRQKGRKTERKKTFSKICVANFV